MDDRCPDESIYLLNDPSDVSDFEIQDDTLKIMRILPLIWGSGGQLILKFVNGIFSDENIQKSQMANLNFNDLEIQDGYLWNHRVLSPI